MYGPPISHTPRTPPRKQRTCRAGIKMYGPPISHTFPFTLGKGAAATRVISHSWPKTLPLAALGTLGTYIMSSAIRGASSIHRFIDSSNHRSTDFRFFGGRCRGKNLRFGVVLYSAHCVYFSVLLALGETNAIFLGTFGCKNLDSYTLYSGKILLNLGSFFCNLGSFLSHFGGLLALWITF